MNTYKYFVTIVLTCYSGTWITYLLAFFFDRVHFLFLFLYFTLVIHKIVLFFRWCWWCVRICISYFIHIALHFTASFVCDVCWQRDIRNHIVYSSLCMHDIHTESTTSFNLPSPLVGYGFRCAAHSMLCIWTVRTHIVRSPASSSFIHSTLWWGRTSVL